MQREPTGFECRVYDAVSMIPRGRVSTYAAVARVVNCGSTRAIGQALRRCPFGPEIPCHRVISASLRPGGYSGEADGLEVERKRRLLEREGVQFDENGNVKKECLYLEFD